MREIALNKNTNVVREIDAAPVVAGVVAGVFVGGSVGGSVFDFCPSLLKEFNSKNFI